jgi:Zn finger protein HypA/HybF involved in hydrogenase expression
MTAETGGTERDHGHSTATEREVPMETRSVFCPKCQHDVQVAVSTAPLHGGPPSVGDMTDAELVCLDFGSGCSGTMCTAFGLPRVVMGVRLARSGLRPERLDTVRAVCDGCGRFVELEVVDDTHAFCPQCNTINVWTLIRLDGDEWVAVTGQRAESEL